MAAKGRQVLHHFASVLCLPTIMRAGLAGKPHLLCTTDGDWRNQQWDDGVGFDRTRVRITVDVDALSSREYFTRYPRPIRIQRAIVPYEMRVKWFFVVETIPPERFVSVDLREDDGTYSPLSPFDLDALVECVEAERERSLRVTKHRTGTEVGLREGVFDSWLGDGGQTGLTA